MSASDDGARELLESFRDSEYRHYYQRASYKRGLAEQIREMRLNRGWTQAELAASSGKVQETISQLENPNYGSYTLKTLDRLAEAFDVALIVRFAPFSELAAWMANLSPDDLAVPDFEHDSGRNRLFDPAIQRFGIVLESGSLNAPTNSPLLALRLTRNETTGHDVHRPATEVQVSSMGQMTDLRSYQAPATRDSNVNARELVAVAGD